jgi:hypothetical protein
MKITMLKNMQGSGNAMGNVSMTYEEGQTYDMTEGWQKEIANAFVDAGGAKEVGAKETKTVEPTEKQAEEAPVKKTRKKKK